MATGGRAAKLEKLTCTICLELFRSPRLLPCHHTFCLQCIEDLAARHRDKAFPCPTCRRQTKVPAGGVKTFQVNFYLEDDVSDARKAPDAGCKGPQPDPAAAKPLTKDLLQWLADFDPEESCAEGNDMCPRHPDEKLRFVCVACGGQPICRDCKLTRHEGHQTDDVDSQAKQALDKLRTLNDRVGQQVKQAQAKVKDAEEKQQAFYDKRVEVKRTAQARADLLVTWVEECRRKMVQDLMAGGQSTDHLLLQNAADANHCLTTGKKLKSVLQQVLRSPSRNKAAILRMAEEIEGREVQLKAMVDELDSHKNHAVSYLADDAGITEESVKAFVLSSLSTCSFSSSSPMLRLRPVFKVDCDVNMVVHSICPVAGGKVWVACGSSVPGGKGHVVLLDADGQEVRRQEVRGRVSLTSLGGDRVRVGGKNCEPLFLDAKDSFSASLFFDGNSSQWSCQDALSTRALRFFLYHEGQDSYLVEEKTKGSEGGKVRINRRLLGVVCDKKSLAFDANSAGSLIAIVHQDDRGVYLYKTSNLQSHVSVFREQNPSFLPRSVCFYRHAGNEMLLVADFGLSTLDVVLIQGHELSYETSLGGDCPQLLKPSCLAPDDAGRVWIGCQGGQVLLASPPAAP